MPDRRSPLSRACLPLLIVPLLALAACRSAITPPPPRPPAAALPPPATVELVGQAALSTGFRFGGHEVGGLSGLAYDAAGDLFYAVVDDPNEHPPARVLRFRWHPPAAPELVDWVLLTDVAGSLPPGLDLEGLARDADGDLFISSEGDVREGRAPWVARFDAAGRLQERLPLPPGFTPAEGRGPRHNQALEALSLGPQDEVLLGGMEGPLEQDEPPPAGEPRRSRLLRWDLLAAGPPEQWLYPLAPPHAEPAEAGGLQVAGLVDLRPWGQGNLLALERSWVAGVGFDVKLFEATLDAAEPLTGGDDGVAGQRLPTVRKRLLADLATLGVIVDNYECTAWLPVAGGEPLLVVLSDNNFNAPVGTRLLALRVTGKPTLPSHPLALDHRPAVSTGSR